jgi:cyclic di-GMP phosphodiesterase Gmr
MAGEGVQTLRAVAAVLGLAAGGYVAIATYFGVTTGLIPWMALVLMGAVLAFVQLGRFRMALATLLWGAMVLALVGGVRRAGFNTPTLMALPVLVTAGGWLLGKRQGFAMIAVAFFGVMLIAWMQWAGFPDTGAPVAPFGYALVTFAVIVCGGVLGATSSSSFERQYRKAMALSDSLSLQLTEVQDAKQRLHALVYVDAITGLRSAHGQRERMRELMARETPFALMTVNLDGFRLINDNFGPTVGNAVIARVGQVLAGSVGHAGEPARSTGAEFTVLVPELVDKAALKTLATQVLEQLREPVLVGDLTVYPQASIGMACSPQDSAQEDDLIRMADVALHATKTQGGSGVCGYEPHMDTDAQEFMWLDQNLRGALQAQQMALHYQPKLRLRDGAVVSVEALLRWTHPERGAIRPDKFIARAEATGTIIPIGRWVLASAAQQAAQWAAAGMPVRIAVNVSAKQLADAELLGHLKAAQALAGGLLDIELTESCVADKEHESQFFMAQCRSMGYGVHLDDFGTGYSSLARLAQLPLTMIKLDRAFVRPIGTDGKSDSLLRAMVSIGRELDLSIVAEGVETPAQAEFLNALGVQYVQGWLYAAAMAPQACREWVCKQGVG